MPTIDLDELLLTLFIGVMGAAAGRLALGALGDWLLRRDKVGSALWTGVRIGGLVFVLGLMFYYVVLSAGSIQEEKVLIGVYFIFPALAFVLAAAYTFVARRPRPASH